MGGDKTSPRDQRSRVKSVRDQQQGAFWRAKLSSWLSHLEDELRFVLPPDSYALTEAIQAKWERRLFSGEVVRREFGSSAQAVNFVRKLLGNSDEADWLVMPGPMPEMGYLSVVRVPSTDLLLRLFEWEGDGALIAKPDGSIYVLVEMIDDTLAVHYCDSTSPSPGDADRLGHR